MISKSAEYSLQAAVCLAGHGGEAVTAQQIAQETQIPAGYLSKVLQNLAREGLVTSHRGLHGGFALKTTADRLTLMDIVGAVDPSRRITACPLKIQAHQSRHCPLRSQDTT